MSETRRGANANAAEVSADDASGQAAPEEAEPEEQLQVAAEEAAHAADGNIEPAETGSAGAVPEEGKDAAAEDAHTDSAAAEVEAVTADGSDEEVAIVDDKSPTGAAEDHTVASAPAAAVDAPAAAGASADALPAAEPAASGQAQRRARSPQDDGEQGAKRPRVAGGAADGGEADPDDPMQQPPHGTELFFGNLPHECAREDIQAFCETAGELHKLYVPQPKTAGAKNAGYAFAMYKSRIAAAEAIEQLQGKSIPTASMRRPLTVKYANKQRHKLYVCNIPRGMRRPELLAAFRGLVRGVVDLDVTMQKDQGKPDENRGFCFLDMYNQPAADAALAVLNNDVDFAGQKLRPQLRVEWADTKHEGDLTQARSLHVSNLPDGCTEDELRGVFEELASPVERVAIMNDWRSAKGGGAGAGGDGPRRLYAFVHYAKRSLALRALEKAQEEAPKLGSHELAVATAKPSQRDHMDGGRDRGMGMGGGGGGGGGRGGPPIPGSRYGGRRDGRGRYPEDDYGPMGGGYGGMGGYGMGPGDFDGGFGGYGGMGMGMPGGMPYMMGGGMGMPGMGYGMGGFGGMGMGMGMDGGYGGGGGGGGGYDDGGYGGQQNASTGGYGGVTGGYGGSGGGGGRGGRGAQGGNSAATGGYGGATGGYGGGYGGY